jgi:hypothetical protein
MYVPSSGAPIKNELRASLPPASESAPTTPGMITEEATMTMSHISRPDSPTMQGNSRTLHHVPSIESNRTISSMRQSFQLSKLPTPRMALLTGSRRLVSRLGQSPTLEHPDTDIEASPVCYLLDKPATLRELTIESAEHLAGHIVVCMHHKVSNIFKFIFNLRYIIRSMYIYVYSINLCQRSPQLKPNELQDIVFLCTSLPTPKTFESLSRFPKVFFMVVS